MGRVFKPNPAFAKLEALKRDLLAGKYPGYPSYRRKTALEMQVERAFEGAQPRGAMPPDEVKAALQRALDGRPVVMSRLDAKAWADSAGRKVTRPPMTGTATKAKEIMAMAEAARKARTRALDLTCWEPDADVRITVQPARMPAPPSYDGN